MFVFKAISIPDGHVIEQLPDEMALGANIGQEVEVRFVGKWLPTGEEFELGIATCYTHWNLEQLRNAILLPLAQVPPRWVELFEPQAWYYGARFEKTSEPSRVSVGDIVDLVVVLVGGGVQTPSKCDSDLREEVEDEEGGEGNGGSGGGGPSSQGQSGGQGGSSGAGRPAGALGTASIPVAEPDSDPDSGPSTPRSRIGLRPGPSSNGNDRGAGPLTPGVGSATKRRRKGVGEHCEVCGDFDAYTPKTGAMMLCETCGTGWHVKCLGLTRVVRGPYYCVKCRAQSTNQ